MIHNNLIIENLKYLDDNSVECEEQWKDIIGYKGLYEVSNLGRIKSLPKTLVTFKHKRFRGEKLLCTTTFHPSGYRYVTLIKNKKRTSHSVHRLVGVHFISNPTNLPQINHEDTNKTNNKYLNLSWCTNEENAEHAKKNGLMNYQKGESHGCSKLKEKDIIEIRELFNNGLDKHVIGKRFGISSSHAYNIKRRMAWKHIK